MIRFVLLLLVVTQTFLGTGFAVFADNPGMGSYDGTTPAPKTEADPYANETKKLSGQ